MHCDESTSPKPDLCLGATDGGKNKDAAFALLPKAVPV